MVSGLFCYLNIDGISLSFFGSIKLNECESNFCPLKALLARDRDVPLEAKVEFKTREIQNENQALYCVIYRHGGWFSELVYFYKLTVTGCTGSGFRVYLKPNRNHKRNGRVKWLSLSIASSFFVILR